MIAEQIMWVLIALGPCGPVELGPYQKEADCTKVLVAIDEMDSIYAKHTKCVRISW